MHKIESYDGHSNAEEVVAVIEALLQLEGGNMVYDNAPVIDKIHMIPDKFDSVYCLVQH